MNNRITHLILITFLIFFSKTVVAQQVSTKETSANKTLLIYGDSLSAGYGMGIEQGWVHLLGEDLQDTHIVKNASISGETTRGGLQRLPLILQKIRPDIILIELGANDGLQGQSLKTMYENLEKMVELSQQSGAQVGIIGVSLPATYGPRYIDEFKNTYQRLVDAHKLPYINIYREEFISEEGNIQADGLHPTAKTQPIIKQWVLEFLQNEKFMKHQ